MNPKRRNSSEGNPIVGGLIDRLEERADDIAARMMTTILEQIPAYAALTSEARRSVHLNVRDNVIEWFRVVREERPPYPEELEEFIASGRQRAREGIPLEALLKAYRLGATVGWEATLEESNRENTAELEAALQVTGGLMRYLDHVSTAVAQSYLHERESMVTNEERQNRELLEALLDGGPSEAKVKRLGARASIQLAKTYWLSLITVGGAGPPLSETAQLLRRLAQAYAVIAIARHDDILVLWPGGGAEAPLVLKDAVSLLADQYQVTQVALAGPSSKPLRPLLSEAEVIMQLAEGQSGIVRLEDLPLRSLIHQAGGRTTEVVRRLVEPLVAHDVNRGTDLVNTLTTYFTCNGSLPATAQSLYVHRNTVTYRLGRVHQLTGLDPAVLPNLFLLYAAIQLHGEDLLNGASPGEEVHDGSASAAAGEAPDRIA